MTATAPIRPTACTAPAQYGHTRASGLSCCWSVAMSGRARQRTSEAQTEQAAWKAALPRRRGGRTARGRLGQGRASGGVLIDASPRSRTRSPDPTSPPASSLEQRVPPRALHLVRVELVRTRGAVTIVHALARGLRPGVDEPGGRAPTPHGRRRLELYWSDRGRPASCAAKEGELQASRGDQGALR